MTTWKTAGHNMAAALRSIGDWYGLLDVPPNDQFDRLADEFYLETGYMRPGKDDARGAHTDEERNDAWLPWATARRNKMIDEVRYALKAANELIAADVARAELEYDAMFPEVRP